MHQGLRSAAALMEGWARGHALPYWATAGFDIDNGRFEERLTPQSERIVDVPLRLVVQARQVHVYALAARRRWYAGALPLVERAFDSMRRDYHRRDGREGWAYSIVRDGTVADPTRDFYAHAFVLLAVASYVEATGKSAALAIADETLAFLDTSLRASQGGGYVEALPVRHGHRRQNPHMHLFEALLALWECSRERRYLARAGELFSLFRSCFFQGQHGVVLEYFDEALRPAAGVDGAIVEPGHHHEWCWLLRRYERATGREEAGPLVEALYEHADRYGFDAQGLVVDEILADGTPRSPSHRLWPMTEAIKSSLAEGRLGRPGCLDKAVALTGVLYRRFLAPAMPGAWIDRLDSEGWPIGDFVPASSLYHLMGAVDEFQHTWEDRSEDLPAS